MPGKKLQKKAAKSAYKARRNRIITFSLVGALIVVAAVTVYHFSLVSSLNTACNVTPNSAIQLPTTSPYVLKNYIGDPVPSSITVALKGLSTGFYSVDCGQMSTDFTTGTGSFITVNGKPAVVAVLAEYCPFCAAERWGLTIALDRFGNLTGLDYMLSSPTDQAGPNISTFTYVNLSYSSPYITFIHYEHQNRYGGTLQSIPANYTAIWSYYGSGYPFIDFANDLVLEQATYNPLTLEGYNWSTIVEAIRLQAPAGVAIMSSANYITAGICKADGNKPSSVCSNPTIAKIEGALPGYVHSPLKLSLNTGIPISSAVMWTTVQYTQIAWIRKSSLKTR